MRRYFAGLVAVVASVVAGDCRADPAPASRVVVPEGREVECRYDFCGKSHPAGGCSGYTWFHLPEKSEIPEEERAVVARPAIFAARMAFSSFVIRSRLRYGLNAFSSAC